MSNETASPSPSRRSWTLVMYATTIVLSAFLLFLVQPIIARIILPWFGGSSTVWTTCMLFFQSALLAGYFYAHIATGKLSPKARSGLHLALLLISLATLPILPGVEWKPTASGVPTSQILTLLFVCIGLPYTLLSTTSPLLQSWYAKTHGGALPYRLFALSNGGSLLALVCYPFAIEPWLTTQQQGQIWSWMYGLFVVLCGLVTAHYLWFENKHPEPDTHTTESTTQETESNPLNEAEPDDFIVEQPDDPNAPPTRKRILLWLALATVPSGLLLAVTAHLTHEVAAVPFLWILPLALYLLTFILCFDAEGWYKRKWYMFGLFPAIAIMALFYEMGSFSRSFVFTATTYSLAFFGVCMFCHGELARSKPHPRYLTLFYLMVSVGGAVGGLFVGLVAPFVFPDYYELPMLLFVAAMVAFFALTSDPRSDYFRKWEHPLMLSFLVVIVMLGSWNIARMALTGYEKRVVIRNFYGVVKVRDQHIHSKEKHVRSLYNGSILHGEQWQGKEKRSKPRSFYCEETGLAKTITYAKKQKRAIKVGVLGLGTGTVAAFARSLDTYRFYDINPAVIQVAKTQFTYLKDAKSRGATVQTVVGDARLSLEREPKHGFDVLVVDCFSSDAIPVHLLTKEAFQLYVSHLAKGGVLLLHISNQFLTLDPVVERITRSLKLHTLLIESYDANDGICFGTSWVVIAPDKKTFDDGAFYKAGKPLKAKAGTRLWTDNYSSLFDVLGR